ncbi:MAG: hypothetical protein KIS92_08390 [Planctomycetota bacterium]|nr:hypothetical protein [Planctomycetota bacterium]
MSWFHDRPISEATDASLDADERPGAEVAEGVTVERREVVLLSLGALASLCLGWPQRAAAEDGAALSAPEGDLAWDALLKEALPMAEHLVKQKKPNEEAYLLQLASLVARLDKAPDGTFAPKRAVAAVEHLRKMPFVVVQFKLEANAALPFHDHRDYIGVLSSVAGEAQVRSFKIQGDNPVPPAGKSFEIRETGSRTLTPGRSSHLSRTRDNVHDIRAGKEGARLLDFFTFYSKEGKSVFMNVGEKPKDAEKKIYEATWK